MDTMVSEGGEATQISVHKGRHEKAEAANGCGGPKSSTHMSQPVADR